VARAHVARESRWYSQRHCYFGSGASCVAAARVKPKVRLCEPWVVTPPKNRAPTGRQRSLVLGTLSTNSLSPLRGSPTPTNNCPRLAKPRLGLNSARCYAADFRCDWLLSSEPSKGNERQTVQLHSGEIENRGGFTSTGLAAADCGARCFGEPSLRRN
jgi:hypothetical protein